MILVILLIIFALLALAGLIVFLFDFACPYAGLTCSTPVVALQPAAVSDPTLPDNMIKVISSTDSSAVTTIDVPAAAKQPMIVNPLTLQSGRVV